MTNKRCFAKENSCNKQESQAYDNENTSTSQNVQVAENVSTPTPFPNVSGSFADKNRFHEELEIKLSEELIRYILNDEPKVMLLIILIMLLTNCYLNGLFSHSWLFLFRSK